jgi:NAD(P)-dependent dehydrogenase (short-subunit alcohol dehydrogenase family)
VRVVVTGASRGLGLELAGQHARRGDEVLATCRRPAAAHALGALAASHPGRVRVARLDVDDPASIDAAAGEASAWPGAVDLLWSNAGVYPGSPGTDVAEGRIGTLRASDGLAVLSTNAVGAVLVAQAFLPLLLRGERPRLVGVSSGYGSLAPNEGTPDW